MHVRMTGAQKQKFDQVAPGIYSAKTKNQQTPRILEIFLFQKNKKKVFKL